MFHFGLIPLIVLISATLTSGLVYHCKFKDPSPTYEDHGNVHTLSFTKQLPASRISSHYCVVTTDKSDSFLQVKARALGQANGSLHVAIFDSRDSTIGRLDISTNGPEETETLCPQASGQKYLVLLTGTPNMHYTAEITDNVTEISLDEQKSFEARETTTLFKFKPTVDVTKKQLDITVSSQSDTVAYLKVSYHCKQAKKTRRLDYSKSSLRLTFRKQGRITLSRASQPSLDASGFVYIGISLNNKSDKNLKKPVKLTLRSSFNYNYNGPLFFLSLVSSILGIVIARWAWFCFSVPYIPPKEDSSADLEMLLDNTSESGAGNTDESEQALIGENEQTIPLNITYNERFGAVGKVLYGHWLARGPKMFSYTTCIVGFVLLIGASQFVLERWNGMIESGDRDRCYYNEFCYRVSGFDLPFNLMISNLVYMIHGIILAFSVLWMEAELMARCHRLARDQRPRSPLPEGQDKLPKHCIECPCIDAHLANMTVPRSEPANDEKAILLDAEAHKRKYSFSIGYSFAWALIFEGCFSTVYHFCPTQLTFQFDSAFMFVISGLIVVSLYNGTSFKECTVHGKNQLPVHSNNFFLFFIVPLYIFNYFGSLYFSDHILTSEMKTAFDICAIIFFVILVIWAYFKLFSVISSCNCRDIKKKIKKPLLFILALIVVIVLRILFKGNYPNTLLFGCISTSMIAICGKIRVQFRIWTKPGRCKKIFKYLYVVLTVVIMVIALCIFALMAATDKEKSPAESRDLNHDCVFLDFFDYHDLWHILSSFSLLMGAYLVLYISE
ncbi:PREDICTED: uncharacterized protein LOC107331378 [Acropora digitifera]|uniref:uncharacterized protein LOC107331378 n=1 Tax=Acropora digitifera TaxID=70779 RepID=UPI00077A7810|nr:PREDICTED: uncharacterized protein LOC107331378 [Acropora digitifera]